MATKKSYNQVLEHGFRTSRNFFRSDGILQHFIGKHFSDNGLAYMLEKWEKLGQQAAMHMDALSLNADKKVPELIKRDSYGETLNQVKFHPDYWELMQIAIDSEMFRVKWEPSLRTKFARELHALGFVSGYLFSLGELSQYCPLCMTDGVARLLDRYADKEDQERLLPHVYSQSVDIFFTGAMFLTEKAGGSDVGAGLVSATAYQGGYYYLNGEKWFCSNVNAQIIFALGRTDISITGTKGLSIFLVEPNLPDGTRNPIEIVRLKDKLGVRSMASAECLMTNTLGKLVGEEFQGFAVMADMINLSRLYNSIAALSGSRRALIEAYQFLSYRRTFGKKALEHALIRDKLHELGSLHVANFYLTWRAIKALDAADNADKDEEELLRLLTPMVKKWSAEKAVYIVRESMELMGGIGYIEDTVMPKIMRDVMVLPIWEGAGNIMILDMLRASAKSKGLDLMLEQLEKWASEESDFQKQIKAEYEYLAATTTQLASSDTTIREVTAKYFFERLTNLYQIGLLLEAQDEISKAWIQPALAFLISQLPEEDSQSRELPNQSKIEALMAWSF
ncbi:MAG: acyl-CoA dehydrogenase family protein [Cyclobacteriaceae bacterium]